MSRFGQSADDVFASDVLDQGTAGTKTSSASPLTSWTDRIFSTGSDLLGGFLDLKSKQWLIEEESKYKLAEARQQQMLNTAETGQNVGNRVQPLMVPQQNGGGINRDMLIIGGVVVAAVFLLK